MGQGIQLKSTKIPMLVSYFYLKGHSHKDTLWILQNPKVDVFVDSGAFSAYNSGKQIDLNAYINWLHCYKKHIWRYATLDEIKDPKKTQENYQKLRKEGLCPVPIHTIGMNQKDLNQMFQHNNLVMIGGLRALQGGSTRQSYLKMIMRWANKRNVHWLGYTNAAMLQTFHPYSCDSSSWGGAHRYGRMSMYYGNGQWEHLQRKTLPPVTSLSQKLRRYLIHCGFDTTDLYNDQSWQFGPVQTGSNFECMSMMVTARSWIQYTLEFQKRFRTRIFLANCMARMETETIFYWANRLTPGKQYEDREHKLRAVGAPVVTKAKEDLVGLVACCKTKRRGTQQAKDLYDSPLFRYSRHYAERCYKEWGILSAKHGLVMPNQKIETYEQTLAQMTKAERAKWARRVHRQITVKWPKKRFVVLAGEMYSSAVDGLQTEFPLQGLPLGKRLQRLKQLIQEL